MRTDTTETVIYFPNCQRREPATEAGRAVAEIEEIYSTIMLASYKLFDLEVPALSPDEARSLVQRRLNASAWVLRDFARSLMNDIILVLADEEHRTAALAEAMAAELKRKGVFAAPAGAESEAAW